MREETKQLVMNLLKEVERGQCGELQYQFVSRIRGKAKELIKLIKKEDTPNNNIDRGNFHSNNSKQVS